MNMTLMVIENTDLATTSNHQEPCSTMVIIIIIIVGAVSFTKRKPSKGSSGWQGLPKFFELPIKQSVKVAAVGTK